MSQQLALGVDIGGTKIAFALVDRHGQIHMAQRIATDAGAGAAQVIARLLDGIADLLTAPAGQIVGIGVGVPGYVDSERGVVRKAVNLGWEAVPLAQIIRERFGLPVSVHKDANAAALGEVTFGAAQDCSDVVCVEIGTGLGIGVVVNGAVVTGSSGAAGELAHTALNPNGRACPCGLCGCPEAYVSGVGLLAGLGEHASRYPQSTLARSHAATTADILTAAAQNDPLAQHVLDEAFSQLGQLLLVCAGLLNPQRFVIGGGLGMALLDWLPRLETYLQQRTQSVVHEHLRVVPSQLQSNAQGAAALVWNMLP